VTGGGADARRSGVTGAAVVGAAGRGAGSGARVARGQVRRDGAVVHWDFNDVDVSAARDPQSKLHFWVEVDGIRTYSNFWTHGVDARTYLPNPDVLLGDCA